MISLAASLLVPSRREATVRQDLSPSPLSHKGRGEPVAHDRSAADVGNVQVKTHPTRRPLPPWRAVRGIMLHPFGPVEWVLCPRSAVWRAIFVDNSPVDFLTSLKPSLMRCSVHSRDRSVLTVEVSASVRPFAGLRPMLTSSGSQWVPLALPVLSVRPLSKSTGKATGTPDMILRSQTFH